MCIKYRGKEADRFGLADRCFYDNWTYRSLICASELIMRKYGLVRLLPVTALNVIY